MQTFYQELEKERERESERERERDAGNTDRLKESPRERNMTRET